MTVGKWVYELSLIPGLLLVYAMLSIIDIKGIKAFGINSTNL